MFSEGARDEVVRFFQRQDANCECQSQKYFVEPRCCLTFDDTMFLCNQKELVWMCLLLFQTATHRETQSLFRYLSNSARIQSLLESFHIVFLFVHIMAEVVVEKA